LHAARTGQTLFLLGRAKFRQYLAIASIQAEIAGKVALIVLVVRAIAVGMILIRCEAQPFVVVARIYRGLGVPTAVTARAEFDLPGQPLLRRLGDDVYRAAGGVITIERGAATARDFDALDGRQGNGRPFHRAQVEAVQSLAVEQHQRVLIAGHAETAQVNGIIRRTRSVADMDARLLRQQFWQ